MPVDKTHLVDLLWQWLQKNWLYTVPYLVVLFLIIIVTHLIKNLKKKNGDLLLTGDMRQLFTLVISLIASFGMNLLICLLVGFNVLLYIVLSLMCWVISGFITAIFDALTKAGLFLWITDYIKRKLRVDDDRDRREDEKEAQTQKPI